MPALILPGGDVFSNSPVIASSLIATPYEGLIASKAGYLSTFSGTNKQVQSRSYHVAADDITALKIAVTNWYMSIADGGIGITTTEVGSGGNCTLAASVEYPLGSYTQIKFNTGSSSIVLADGETKFSDYCTISIPRGAVFGIGQYRVYAGNGVYNPFRNASVGGAASDQCHAAASGLADVTMGGTLTDDGVNGCPPCAIIGMTIRPSIIQVGDSSGGGRFTTNSQPDYRQGIFCKALPVDYPFLNLSLGGEAAANSISNSPGRKQLWKFCSHFVLEYFWNDYLSHGGTAATVKTAIEAIFANTTLLPASIKRFPCTIIPGTDSTDSWKSDANQSFQFAGVPEGYRASLNTTIRASGITGQNGYVEIAYACESSPGNGLWKSDGVTNFLYTSDGIHSSQNGYLQVSTAALGDMSQFHYP